MEENQFFLKLFDKELDSNLEKICCAYTYDLYNQGKKAEEIYGELIEKYEENKLSFHEAASLIFALSEHARINKDRKIIDNNIELMNNLTHTLMNNCYKLQPNLFGHNSDRINTSTLGMIYGGLISINNYLKSDSISSKIKDIKNFVFRNNISKGTLVNGNVGNEVSIDIILSSVPFGMFSPEDLVLIEAVKEIEEKLVNSDKAKRYLFSEEVDSISSLILAWYYTEKGNYNRAKVLLKSAENIGINKIYEESLYLIISKKLELIGEIGDNTIIHRPYGNYNRYIPQLYERFPKEPLKGDKVIINAVTWPIDSNMEVYLNYKVNNHQGLDIPGKLKAIGSESFWQWEIGPFREFDEVEYYIFIKGKLDNKSEDFNFTVTDRNFINKVNNIEIKDGIIFAYGFDKYKNNSPKVIFEPKSNGILNVSTGKKESYEKTNKIQLQTINDENTIKVIWENSCLQIEKDPFSFSVYNNEKLILQSEHEGISWYEDKKGNISKLRCDFKTEDTENYYGFGERYNDINQKGNSPDVYVYNQYKEQGIKTYIPVPFFISSKGYGIYIKTNSFVKYDMESQNSNNYSFTIEDDEFTYAVIPGSPKQIINEFTNITGKPKMLPKWALGPWMSSNNWDSDVEVRKQVELTKKYNIPSTVLVIEAWSDEATYYIFNDAVYEENDGGSGFKYSDFKFPEWGRWPNPKGLVEYLHENNLKCILWQIPIIKYMNGLHHIQKDADEEYFIKKGYEAKDENSKPYRMPEGWFKDSLLMDFSNPEGSRWWFDKRKYLVEDVKVDGFKTDGGEFVFGNNIQFFDGKTGKSMRNLYPNNYIEAYYNFINELNPNGGITFSRAGFTGAQRFPAHWAGDESSNFNAFKNSITAGLNSGMSGITFWGWDLAGFSGEIPTAELFIRSAQMAAFCPIMQYHAESKAEFNQDRTPWNIADRTGDTRALDIYRYYANLRMNLLPYIYEEALKSCSLGIPLMRALLIEYPEDENCLTIKDEYMFGDKMLVAPIVEEGAEGRSIYLPEGKWIYFWDNKLYEGSKEIFISCGLDKIPVFIKANNVIPLNLNNDLELGGNISSKVDCYENLCFRLYGDKINHYDFKDDLGNSLNFNFIEENKLQVDSNLDIDHYYLIKDDEIKLFKL